MSEDDPTVKEAPRSSSGCGKFLLILLLALIASGTVIFIYLGKSAGEMFDKMGRGFFTREVKVDASNILVEINRTHGDLLEVASPMKTVEMFKKSDTRFGAWGLFYMGTSTSEIKVPATYRFHVKLSELKDAAIRDKVLVVTAPEITPSLPVAFDSTGMEKKADGGWLRFNSAEVLGELEKSLTPELGKRAHGHLPTVREHARKDIEEFVQKWIVDSHPDYHNQIVAVKVFFPGEERPKETPAPIP